MQNYHERKKNFQGLENSPEDEPIFHLALDGSELSPQDPYPFRKCQHLFI